MDPLEQDQEFFAARLESDDFFRDVTVLLQRKGVTESDIDEALSTLLSKDDRLGAVVVVLKPALLPTEPDAPGPEYKVSLTVQVITQPMFNDGDTGTGKTSEQIAARIRTLLHRFATSGGTFSFAAMDPVDVPDGKDSYSVTFTRLARDCAAQCGLPLIDPDEGVAPQTVALSCATVDAEIWYTLDGSYPAPGNELARLYLGPLDIAAAGCLYAGAYKAGLLPSGLAHATFD